MTSERRGFVTGGTWCVDYNMTVPRWPDEDSSTRILSSVPKGGGSGCNFAVDMRVLAPEIPVSTIALCGDDSDGDLLRSIAKEYGVDASRFVVDPSLRTHRTMAFTSLENGRRTHLFEADSSDQMNPHHFDFSGVDAWMLHLGIPGTHRQLDEPWRDSPNGWAAVLQKARAAGLKTNMEVMSVSRSELRGLISPCLPLLDFLIVNDYEIGAMAEVTTIVDGRTSTGRVIEAAHATLARGAMELVVVHFPEGAIAVDRTGAVHIQPSTKFPKDKIKGANGAGDAFAAGFFCGMHRGKPVQDCLAYAHAAAAASLRSVDTYGAMETIEDCLELARRHGWRPELDVSSSGEPAP